MAAASLTTCLCSWTHPSSSENITLTFGPVHSRLQLHLEEKHKIKNFICSSCPPVLQSCGPITSPQSPKLMDFYCCSLLRMTNHLFIFYTLYNHLLSLQVL